MRMSNAVNLKMQSLQFSAQASKALKATIHICSANIVYKLNILQMEGVQFVANGWTNNAILGVRCSLGDKTATVADFFLFPAVYRCINISMGRGSVLGNSRSAGGC